MAPLRRRRLRLVTTPHGTPAPRCRRPRRGRDGTSGPASFLRFRLISDLRPPTSRRAKRLRPPTSRRDALPPPTLPIPLPDNSLQRSAPQPLSTPRRAIFFCNRAGLAQTRSKRRRQDRQAPLPLLPASILQLQPTEAHPATRPMHPDGGSVPATKQARPEPVEGLASPYGAGMTNDE